VTLMMVSDCSKYKFESEWEKKYGEIYVSVDGAKAFCVAGPTAVMLEDDTVIVI
jgi:hypothetical protein